MMLKSSAPCVWHMIWDDLCFGPHVHQWYQGHCDVIRHIFRVTCTLPVTPKVQNRCGGMDPWRLCQLHRTHQPKLPQSTLKSAAWAALWCQALKTAHLDRLASSMGNPGLVHVRIGPDQAA